MKYICGSHILPDLRRPPEKLAPGARRSDIGPSPREVAPTVSEPTKTAREPAIERATEPADPPHMGLAGQTLGGRYCIERQIGEGGMAYVYLARDLESDGEVAIKVLLPQLTGDPTSVERLRREAVIAIRPELPANLETVIGRALAQDPADRFQSVAELSAGFASVTAKTGVFERLFGKGAS